MDRRVIHRDRQELQSADLNNMMLFPQAALDRLVSDGFGAGLFFTGFSPQETGTWEITLGEGRFYSAGAVHRRVTSTVIDLFSQRPVSQKKVALITAWGQAVETDVQPRDFLIDAEAGTTEPQSVPMEALRSAEIGTLYGTEATTPVDPTIPNNNVLIARVVLTTSGIESIGYETSNILPQALRNQTAIDDMALWRALIEDALATFRSDMATMAAAIALKANRAVTDDHESRIQQLEAKDQQFQADIDNLRTEVSATSLFLLHDVELFSTPTKSDTDHLDYNARLSGGLRFPFAAEDTPLGGLALLNASDPKVTVVDNIVRPKANEATVLDIKGSRQGSAALNSYSSTTSRSVAHTGTRSVQVAGLADVVIQTFPKNAYPPVLAVAGQPYSATNVNPSARGPDFVEVRYDGYEPATTRSETYTYYTTETDTVDHTAHGRAQTFMMARGGWVNEVQLSFASLDSNHGMTIILCETDEAGAPKMSRTLSRTTVTFTQLNVTPVNGLTPITVPPIYLSAGQRFAVVLLSEGAHALNLASGTRGISQGQHFALTAADTWSAPGDQASYDVEMKLAFDNYDDTSVTVDLQPLQLAGGLTNVKFESEMMTPAGCSLRFEVQYNGAWYAIHAGQSLAEFDWSQNSAILPLRVTFMGTRDVMPALGIGSRSAITVGRMGSGMVHISELIDVGAGNQASKIRIKTRLENFDEALHDCTIALVVGGSDVAAVSTTDEVLDSDSIIRTAVFDLGVTPTQTFAAKITGTAVSSSDTFMVSERYAYAAV
ncbi:MAG: hypothetical protein JJ902_05470 [Roseibium sp.]|nr:hypothetical protein [Roseibium sp.]